MPSITSMPSVAPSSIAAGFSVAAAPREGMTPTGSSFQPVAEPAKSNQLYSAQKQEVDAKSIHSNQAAQPLLYGESGKLLPGKERAATPEDTPRTAAGETNEEQAEQALKAKKEQQVEAKIQEEIRELAARDREVRAHEQAHAAVGGSYAGAPKYQFERGPDGVNYAVGGEVPIDVGPAATPEQTIAKAQTIRRAALAPAEPSPQDRQVAQESIQLEAAARQELQAEIRAKEESLTPAPEEEQVSAVAESTSEDQAAIENNEASAILPGLSSRGANSYRLMSASVAEASPSTLFRATA